MLKKSWYIFFATFSLLTWIYSSAFSSSVYAQQETCDGLPATIIGTNGNDTITGTYGPDVIVGLGGNDTVYGESEISTPAFIPGTNDRIFGEGGSDLLIGDFRTINIPLGVATVSSSDYIDGGEGADTIAGGFIDATNTAIGGTDLGSGNDTLLGGEGNDIIYGWGRNFSIGVVGSITLEDGNTTISGDDGSDTIYGDVENLSILVGSFITNGWRDTIDGGSGNDTIYGGSGNDTIYGDVKVGNNNITPIGTGNNDTINGGVGTDTGDAGPGTDTCTNMESITNCEL
ncbi:hypothetical protein COL00_31035 [Bacillus cereus]|nr:hypothetical protein COL00_31035 [Bacillus cereus]